ncbi:hypothetical protein LBMAG53_03170 [Planctomycetota bacterium]|nr:hypothetical protein LBMAG53_03170 [Planctomycetota bacterium]
MDLHLYRHTWGMDEPWTTAFPKLKALGFIGIETNVVWATDEQRSTLRPLLDQHGFKLIMQVFTGALPGGPECPPTPEAHLASLETQVIQAKSYRADFINAHTGRDAWTFDQALAFYRGCLDLEQKHQIVISHETHRGRYFFNPRDTRAVLEALPSLKITADYSHFVCVLERLPRTMDFDPAFFAKHAWHVHARVGHPEGPQVNDPRAPEWADTVAWHETCWDAIFTAAAAAGRQNISLTPEFGPRYYMPTLPYTKAPVADLWDICTWQAHRQRDRYAAQFGKAGASQA